MEQANGPATDAPAAPRRILVVEDQFLLADELRRDLEGAGARVLGPVPTVAEALRLLEAGESPDAAVLDVNLRGEMVFPLARALRARGVPVLFVTGYDAWVLPPDLAGLPRLEKPLGPGALRQALGLPA